MTQGTYTRCKEKGCRKKAAKESPYCPAHKDMARRRAVEVLKKANPSMVQLIEAIIDEKLEGRFSDIKPIKPIKLPVPYQSFLHEFQLDYKP